MESFIPILFASIVGFQHAFEADHLVAVSSIVSKRNNSYLAIKDGIYWGLGHTSTILLIGMLILVGKFALSEQVFTYLEAVVGAMLIGLGMYRLGVLFIFRHSHQHLVDENDNHHLAYSVGAVHGLAGSGAMILLVVTEIKETMLSLMYLSIFGVGSIVGMLIAAGLFSLPFSKNFTQYRIIHLSLSVLSSLLCVMVGGLIVYKNIYG
ncbi:MAG TPA: urease accessory protein [Microscillaceae bacterium]|jgi:uncharacterized membrane protein YedE/YeeE|nr:urease accessory protein [Microscillaceae bacterium]